MNQIQEFHDLNSNATVSDSACTTSSIGTVTTWWPYQEWTPAVPNFQYWYNVVPVIDYDLLAQKIVDKLKGEEKKSVEDIRKELNRLLDQLTKK